MSRQGFGQPQDFGPKAPTTVKALLAHLENARRQGFSSIVEVFAPGMSAMSAPIRRGNGPAFGVVTIAGPLIRLTEERMQALGPALLQTTQELAMTSSGSALLKNRG